MSKNMTVKQAVELVKKYSEEMPSSLAAKVLNSMAHEIFVKKSYAILSTSRDTDIYRTIKIKLLMKKLFFD